MGKNLWLKSVVIVLFFSILSCEVPISELEEGSIEKEDQNELLDRYLAISKEILASSSFDSELLVELEELQIKLAPVNRGSLSISDSGSLYTVDENLGQVDLAWEDCSSETGFVRYEVYQKNGPAAVIEYSGTNNSYIDTDIFLTKLNMYEVLKIINTDLDGDGTFEDLPYIVGRGTAAPDPANDPAHNWDWTDESWFNNKGIENPYSLNGQLAVTGLFLSGSTSCQEVNGWKLYTRRILNADFGKGVESGLDPLAISDEKKFFSLYNEYFGIMRTFIYIRENEIGTTYLNSQVTIEQGNTTSSIVGALINTPNESITLDEKDNNILRDSSVTQTRNERVWYIIDTELAYDEDFYDLPISERSDVSLCYNIGGVLESDISIRGAINLNNYTPGSTSNPSLGISDLVSLGTSGYSDANQYANSLDNFATGLLGSDDVDVDGSYPSDGNDNFINTLGKTILNSNTMQLGVIGASISAIVKLSNILTPSYTGPKKVGYTKGVIEMSGEINTNLGLITIKIPYLGSDIGSGDDLPYYIKENPNKRLGLFSNLTKQNGNFYILQTSKERVWMYNFYMYFYTFRMDLRELSEPNISINPYSGMEIEEIKMAPHCGINVSQISDWVIGSDSLYNDGVGRFYMNFPLIDIDDSKYTSTSDNIPYFSTIKTVLKKSNYLDLFNSAYSRYDKVKVYYKFKNVENPDIEYERMDLYDLNSTYY